MAPSHSGAFCRFPAAFRARAINALAQGANRTAGAHATGGPPGAAGLRVYGTSQGLPDSRPQPRSPEEARAALAPLERLPSSAIPDSALKKAVAVAARARPGLRFDPANPKVARGSVADVFRLRAPEDETPIALKVGRPDALPRVRSEADILRQMADESELIAPFAGRELAPTLAEMMRDAARALLREIDFKGEAANLWEAAAFYRSNRHVQVPKPEGAPLEEGIFMEFADGLSVVGNSTQ